MQILYLIEQVAVKKGFWMMKLMMCAADVIALLPYLETFLMLSFQVLMMKHMEMGWRHVDLRMGQ